MDFILKQKASTWFIIALVIINIISLSFIWYMTLHKPPLPPPPQSPAKLESFFDSELNLSSDQKEEFRSIMQEHRDSTEAIKMQIDEIRKQLFNAAFNDENNVNIDSLTNQIGIKQAHFDKFIFHHFRELAKVCNKEQRQKLEQIMKSSILPEPRRPMPPR